MTKPLDAATALQRRWASKAGLEAYVVFTYFDGPVEHAEALVRVPLARLVVRTTKACVHLAGHVLTTSGRYAAITGRTPKGALPLTYLLHGVRIGTCTIEWKRGCQSWHKQLEAHNTKVMKVL